MKVLYLVSAGGAAMRRSVRETIALAAPLHETRMLAPDAEAKALRDAGVPTESWRPAGLFNVLRAIGVLRRAVQRDEPDAIHAFGWTAAAVALGALPSQYARRILVRLQDPIRKNEMPRAFIEKRLPELLVRAWRVDCAYETLRRVLVETLRVPDEKVVTTPYGVAAQLPAARRAADRAGPIVGFAGRLESDRSWEVALDATALVARNHASARLVFGRSGPVAGLVRTHARAAGIIAAVQFAEDLPSADLFAGIDLLVVPGSFDGLPYALVEALVNGVPVVGADVGGISDTLGPYAGWLVPDDARGFAAGIAEAWAVIDDAWAAARGQVASAGDVFSFEKRAHETLAAYEAIAAQPRSESAGLRR